MLSPTSHPVSLSRLSRRIVLCTGLLLSLCTHAAARDQYSESEVAVALLYNVTKFVRWPAGSFASEDAPLRVCTYSSEEFRAPMLALEQRTVGSHPVKVVELGAGMQVADLGCHVLFFTDPGQLENGWGLEGIEKQPVLTVGSFREFSERGGMLSLARIRKRTEIRINAGLSKRAGLDYNAQLLELATIFNRGDGAATEWTWPARDDKDITLLALRAMLRVGDRNS